MSESLESQIKKQRDYMHEVAGKLEKTGLSKPPEERTTAEIYAIAFRRGHE